jgi:hypothetical protein
LLPVAVISASGGDRGDGMLTTSDKDYSAFAVSPADAINHPNAWLTVAICIAAVTGFTGQRGFSAEQYT